MSRSAIRRGGHGDPDRTESIYNDDLFLRACSLAGLRTDEKPPTRRQARKWGQRYGAAWAKRAEAREALESGP